MAMITFFHSSQFMLLVCLLVIHGRAESTCISCSVDSPRPCGVRIVQLSQVGKMESPTSIYKIDSPRRCSTYISYFAKSSEFLDLVSISNLFGVDAFEIAKASNVESERAPLFDGQLLLVPVDCNFTENGFFHNIAYKMKQGDTFYHVCSSLFENLSDSNMTERINPALDPTKLQVGVEVLFPLYCNCPDEKSLNHGIKHLITYVWQPDDEVSRVSTIFNVSEQAILEAIKHHDATKPIFVPVSKLPRLSQSRPRRKKTKHHVVVIVSVAFGLSVLLFLLVYICFIYTKKKVSNVTILQMKQNKQLFLPVVSEYLGKPIVYDFKVITDATMNFNKGFKIGKSVYKAEINGETLAIKEAKRDARDELMILQRVNHINLVKLVGLSSANDDDESFYLVYEFAEKGSLDKWLYSASVNSHLTWRQRLNIALDVANGLQYMHHHTQPSIVHGDIKTSSLLLDLRFRAKISNLSKATPATGPLSTKVDVFAFGVVILELLSGRKENEQVVMLCEEIRQVLEDEGRREEKLRDWMDPKLEISSYPIEGALSLAVMAKACTQDDPLSRPSMAEIVFNLSVLAEKSWVPLLEVDEFGHTHIPIRAR